MKLIGNSLYERCVMNKEKHVSMNYANDNNITKRINDPHFKDLDKISEETYEVFSSKIKIKMDVPIQVGCAVFDLAKLCMLQFYYNCIKLVVLFLTLLNYACCNFIIIVLNIILNIRIFVYCQMDTDSAYIALSGNFYEELIKPELKEELFIK